MTQNFTILRGDKKIAEVHLKDKEIKVKPKNLLGNLGMFPAMFSFYDVLKALKKSGYRITIEKGPLELSLE